MPNFSSSLLTNNILINIHFTIERESNHTLPFLDLLLNDKSPHVHFHVTTVYRKKTLTGVLTNFLSFTPPCYKRGLVKTFIYKTFKAGFSEWHSEFVCYFAKNLYHKHVLDILLPCYVTKAVEGNDTRPWAGVKQQELQRHYFKIPYIGYFSGVALSRVRKLINQFCKPTKIKFVHSTFKIKNLFNMKDPLPDRLHMRIIYKFSCPGTCMTTSSDRSSHIKKNLQTSESCHTCCNLDCFKILDSAPIRYPVKLK